MKTTKIFIFCVMASFIFLPVLNVNAAMFDIPTNYGYDESHHICREKRQYPPDGTGVGAPQWEYYDLRECRFSNPEIIFYTGFGIIIWAAILVLIILFQYIIYPRFKKRSAIEKRTYVLSDIVAIGLILFFFFLLQHFFVVPRAYYNYGSDIDHLIYMNLIRSQIPTYFFFGYLLTSLARLGAHTIRFKRKK